MVSKDVKPMNLEEQEIMDDFLLSTQYLEESKQIPLEILENDYEKELISKCRENTDLTEKELTDLKQLLAKYRGALSKINPAEVEENVTKTRRIINSEKELLKLIDNQENYKLEMIYRLPSGEEVLLNLRVKPLTDSQAISEMQAHVDLFKELNTNERIVWNKAMSGQKIITKEEQKLAEHVLRKYEDKEFNMESKVNKMREFLARQVEFVETDFNTYNQKLKFWKRIEVQTIVDLYNKVREILQLNEVRTEDLFLNG